jgi:signal peptidase I
MEMEVSGTVDTPPAPAPLPARREARRGLAWVRGLLKQAMACVLVAALAYGSFQFVTHYVLQSVQVVGASMSPTLHDSERYVLNRWVYHVREPQPKDIVVLRDPVDNCYAIKRIVARQGDAVHLKAGQIYVNGKLLDEPYLPAGTPTFPNPNYREQFIVCGVDKYFVLGDNRNNSADSRIYGAVSRQNILGLVVP